MVKIHGCCVLRERREVCEAMNFGKYPVLWMEIGSSKAGWEGEIYEGCKASVVHKTRNHGDLILSGRLSMYRDEQKEDVAGSPQYWDHIHLSGDACVLKDRFGYSDVMEDLENAQAVRLEPSQEVIVVFNDSKHRDCWVRKMVTSGQISPHGMSILKLENPKEVDA